MDEYIEVLMRNIEHECDLYAPVLQNVLKLASIKQIIWESSMDACMPSGEKFLRNGTIVSFSSPFTYNGSKTKEEIL